MELLDGLDRADGALTRFVEGRGWLARGFDSVAAWWQAKVAPRFRALEMKPTRELAAKVEAAVREDERALPPAQQTSRSQMADMLGETRQASEARERRTRSSNGNMLSKEDLDPTTKTPPRPATVMLTLRTHTDEEVLYPQPSSKATFNETTGEGISWAAWSWNPITGCLHGCDYCYARAIAHRFTDAYPVGFTPLFHHERLDAPTNTTVPAAHRGDAAYKRVFVCSMADLYGRWVPDEWIQQVHESMLAAPWWEYLLLTKFPARYVGLKLPPKAWVGTSVDEQKRVRIAEDAFRKIDGVKVKWLSLEPLREPLEFSDFSMFDWVVIGAQTETRQPDGIVEAFAPPWEWVCRITAQAKEAGCKVHWKPNLYNGRPGLPPNEYPEG